MQIPFLLILTGGEAGGRLTLGFLPPSFCGNDERRERNLPHLSTPVSRMKFNQSVSGFPCCLVLTTCLSYNSDCARQCRRVCAGAIGPSVDACRERQRQQHQQRQTCYTARLRCAQSAPISSVSLRVPVSAFTYP